MAALDSKAGTQDRRLPPPAQGSVAAILGLLLLDTIGAALLCLLAASVGIRILLWLGRFA